MIKDCKFLPSPACIVCAPPPLLSEQDPKKMGPRPPPGRGNTSKSGARWSLPIFFFLLFTATQLGETLIATPNLELAMMGYDPLMTDVMEQPDQGRKWRLFTAKQRDSLYVETKDDLLNCFVDEVQESTCSPSLTEAVVQTYEEYKSLTATAISFSTAADATTPLGATQFNFEEKAGYGKQNTPKSVLVRNFFNESQREAILVKAECVTHTVTILPFHEPVFTPAFESALYALHLAAVDSNLETRKSVFSRYVRSYGTHFARATHFGYAAYFVKLFATQAKTPAEGAYRRRCMLESARETLNPGGRRRCETTAEHFSRVVAGKFGEEEVDELVTETGSASVSGAGDCDLAAKESPSPRPVAYVLEKISGLFEEAWIATKTFGTNQVRLNATALYDYFEEQLGDHSQDEVKKAETPSKTLCSWRRSITPSETTRPSHTTTRSPKPTTGPSSTTVGPQNITTGPPSTTARPPRTTAGPSATTSPAVTGRIIIVGGHSAPGTLQTPYSVALFGPALPPFPVGLRGNTLSRTQNRVYSCGGGDNSNRKKCWVIDTGTEGAAWHSFDIPWALKWHSAVLVQDEIWFFLNSKLYIFHTRNSANKFREISLGFSFSFGICAVAHGAKTFVLGVGERKSEVRVNTDHSKPEQWEKFSTLLQGRFVFGCLVFGEEVFVTGGVSQSSSTYLSSVEAISLVDGTVRSTGPLGGVRAYHKMAIIEGRPAVLGGFNGTAAMATIETYDERNNSWETLGHSLGEPRHRFGLTQYLP